MPSSRPAPLAQTGEGRPYGEAIHATAVAIDGEALLLLGPSRSGKSGLALALIDRSTGSRPIRLVGDDRVLLTRRGGALIARPHPCIEGFIERRGLGLVSVPFVGSAPVRAFVILGSTTPRPPQAQNFPCLQYVIPEAAARSGLQRGAIDVLDWWRGASTTPAAKRAAAGLARAKD